MATDFEALENIYHEPSRLAIMSELCGAGEGMAFAEIKARCNLTDGNLSRHLQVLQKAGVVKIEKKFVGVKPRTTVFVTKKGKEGFLDYLTALEKVLVKAAEMFKQKEIPAGVPRGALKPKGA